MDCAPFMQKPPQIDPHQEKNYPKNRMTLEEKRKSAALMRINHTGEVCAKVLYRGQLAVAQQSETIIMLRQSYHEETDHLAWTAQRIQELEGRESRLNLAWHSQSFRNWGHCRTSRNPYQPWLH